MSKWININGEKGHSCQLPSFISENSAYGTMLQKRHSGSIWQCDCGLTYEWNGNSFDKLFDL